MKSFEKELEEAADEACKWDSSNISEMKFKAGARWAEKRLRGKMEKEEAKVEIFNLIYGRWNSPYCVDFAQWLSTATTEAREALAKLKNFETTKEKG